MKGINIMKLKKTLTSLLAGTMLILAATACGSADQTASIGSGGIAKTTSTNGNVGEVTLEKGDTYAVISIEGYGDITCKLFPDIAPYGVKNFVDLANSGYYNGLTFHRVISNFMLQGGSKSGDGRSDPDLTGFGVEANENMRHFYGALCYGSSMNTNGSQFYIVNNNTGLDYDTAYGSQYAEVYKSNIEYLESALTSLEEGSTYYNYYSAMIEQMKSQTEFRNNATDAVKAKYAEVGGTPSLDGGYTVFGQTVDGWDVIDAVSAVEVTDNGNGETSKPVDTITITSVVIKTME